MPGMNGTGPLGKGPGTGRGMGPCGQDHPFGRGVCGRGRGGRFGGMGQGWAAQTESGDIKTRIEALEQELEELKNIQRQRAES